jgi:hypothetical protein
MLKLSKCKIKNDKVVIKHTTTVTHPTQLIDLTVFTSITKSEIFCYTKYYDQLTKMFKSFSVVSVDENDKVFVIHT